MTIKTCSVYIFNSLLTCFVNFETRATFSNMGVKLPDLYWNTSNPMFLISNTDHIIDVNQAANPHLHDQINIVCPSYVAGAPKQIEEKHIIYNVNKEEYDMCRIVNSNPRTIAYCTDNDKQGIFTISFRSFSPLPDSLEYHPGQSYYFISTAIPGNIHNREGGYCRTHNMKVVFKVADKGQLEAREVRDWTLQEDGVDTFIDTHVINLKKSADLSDEKSSKRNIRKFLSENNVASDHSNKFYYCAYAFTYFIFY